MFIDAENEFSAAQAVTASAASTNVVDLGVARRGAGEPLKIAAGVQTTLASAGQTATMSVKLQSDDNSSFSSPTTHFTSDAIAEADLVAGYQFDLPLVPDEVGRYLRLYYTVANENFTSGNMDAGIVKDKQTNRYEAMDEFIS